MSISQYFLIISTVILLSFGQILLKIAAVSFQNDSIIDIKIAFAILVYFFATLMWFIVLKMMPLKTAYPFVGLAFIVVPILSNFFLGEELDLRNILGALLIIFGIFISITK